MPEMTPERLNVLVENHRRFRAFLAQRVGDSADAEDILQAAFLKGLQKQDAIRDEESVVAWFYRLLRNALVDYYRHRGAENRALMEIASRHPETEEPEPEVERAVCQCVHDLLPALRKGYSVLLRRVDLEGASIAEVAAETGMAPNNVRVRLHRARTALRKQLKLSCGTCTEHGCLDCTCGRSRRRRH